MWAGTMEAGKPTLQQLRELVSEACQDNPHLTSRLEKAAFLVLLRPIVLLGDHQYQIGSEDGLRTSRCSTATASAPTRAATVLVTPASTGWP